GNPQAAYATGGTLKQTHAVTMHAILVLPAVAWVLSFTDWGDRLRLQIVVISAIGYALVAIATAAGDFTGLGLRSNPIAAIALLGGLQFLVTGLVAIRGVLRGQTLAGIQHR